MGINKRPCKKDKGSFEAAKTEEKEMPKLENETIIRRQIENVHIREIDTEKRTATFVAATENGVMGWSGKEILRMSGVDLTRFNKNPVILDTHDYSSIDAIVANAEVSVEGKNLIAKVIFAEGTKRADEAWQLVKTKFAKTLSVGFQRQEFINILEGESNGEGEDKIEGPAIITTRWKLLEISLVPLPADEDALMRKINKGRENMEVKKTDVTGEQETVVVTEPVKESVIEKTRKAEIIDLTPPGLEEISARCIAEGKTVDESRKLILVELAKKTAPVGTPEPPALVKQTKEEPKVMDISDDVFVRSIIG